MPGLQGSHMWRPRDFARDAAAGDEGRELLFMLLPGGSAVSLSRRRLAPCPAHPCRTPGELGDGSTQDRRQIGALITAWRLVPSGAARWFYPEQAVHLGVDIQGRVLAVVAADQQYPGPARFLERDNHS